MKNEDLNFLAMMGTTSTSNSTPNTSAKEEQCHEKEKINNNVPKNDSVNDNANGNSNGSDTKNGNSKGKSHGNSKDNGKHLSIKKEQGNTNGNTNGSSTSTITSASTDTNTSTDDDENTMNQTKSKKKVYLTRLFLSFTVLVFVTSRASMSSFCHFDESKESYIIRYSQEIKPGVNSSSNVNTNKENCPPIKTANLDQSKSKHKNKQLSQTLCQSSHLILDYMALIVHPYIDYHTILPKSILQKHPDTITSNTDTLSCGCDSDERKKKKKIRNPISIFKKLGKVFKKGKKNKRKVIASDSDSDSNSNSDNASSGAASGGDDDDDWTLYVSQSPELILSTQQSDIMQKTGTNFIERLEKQKEEEENDINADADVRLKNMFWGGEGASGRMASFPWWFPPGTNLEKSKKNQESSGTRLLASYLKIMKWPKNLVTQFPGGVCTDGCPTDFALAHTLEFREKFKPWAMTPSAMDENKKGWFYVRGYSPTRYHASNEQGGSCVLWYRPEFQIKNSKTIEQQARVLVHGIDTCVGDALYRSNGKIGKCNIVLDANNFGLSNIPSMSATKKILTMLQDHFPDRLGVFVIANMAKPAQIFLKMVMPLVPVEVRRKIHVLPSDAEERGNMLKSLVEERFIPTRLGGQDNYVFDANEYYKTGKYKSDFITNEEGIEYVKTMPHHA